ncbi:MAG TPA: DMT family transporter [Ignavibacteria bacterium]|nr:DMT family transporter [Ignavibacteria bacterium]
MKRYSGEGALLLTTLLWSATFVIIKESLVSVSPVVFVSLRFAIASLILSPFIIKAFKKIDRELLMTGLFLSLFFFAGFATQTIGLKYTTATKSGFITGTFILFTPLFQYLIEKKLPKKENIYGIILIVTGLLFLSSKGNTFFNIFTELGGGFNIGDFLTLLSAISFALYLVYLDVVTKKYDYMPLVYMQILFTAVLGIVCAIFLSIIGFEQIKLSFNNQLLFAFFYTSIFATIITTYLQTRYQKTVTPTKAGIIFSFEPLLAALFAFFILDERISSFGYIGGAFIFSGLIITEILGNRNSKVKNGS